MAFDLAKSIALLERTPAAFIALFHGLSANWAHLNEGRDTWSAYDIVGHLIHCEKTDWIPRARIILSDRENKVFEPFDRFAQQIQSQGKTMEDLLEEFAVLRNQNLRELASWVLTESDLNRSGIHPELGPVSLCQLLATWTIHDASHLHQVARVLVKQYQAEVGPWAAYSRIQRENID